jgi:hypothetical protein
MQVFGRAVDRCSVLVRSGVAVALLVGLTACGKTTGPTGVTPPQQQTTQTLVQQGSFSLVAISTAQRAGLPADAARTEFTLSGAGKLDIVVDWTFSGSAVGFGVYQGSCSFSQFYNNSCAQVSVAPAGSGKPARVSVPSVGAGTYTLVVTSAANVDESGSYQIFITR